VILPRTHVDEATAVEWNPEAPNYRLFVGFKDTKRDSIIVPPDFYANFFMDKIIYLGKEGRWPYVPFNGIFKVHPYDFTIEGNYEIQNQENVMVKHKFKGRKL